MGDRTHKRSNRGAAALETALILVPLLAIFLAIVDFGLAIFLRSTFQHAVREGCRYAVTSRTMPGLGHDASITEVVKQHALGFLNDHEDKIHIRYYVPDTLVETDSNAGGNIVEISVEQYSWGWVAPLLRAGSPALLITTRASDRMEPSPGGTPPPR